MRRKLTMTKIYDGEHNLISKQCTYCRKIKSVSEFDKDERTIDGLKLKCKECSKNKLISKKCDCCLEIKSVSEFYKSERTIDGFYSKCKECLKKYRQDNAESIKEYHKGYHQKNKDKINERQRKYGKEYNDKRVQEALQQIKTEVETNPEKYNYREGEKIYGIIYLIHNIKSNKYYVGQTTVGFDNRYQSGWLYTHGRKNDVKGDLELYGENSFEYIKLFKVAHSQYELDKLEAYYINYYNSYENGYNETRGNIFTDRGKEK